MPTSLATTSGGDHWREALILPGHASLLESLVSELAEYLGEDVALVSRCCEMGEQLVAEDWESSKLQKGCDERSIAQFYTANRNYLYDLTKFNAHYPNVSEVEFLSRAAAKARFARFLDFGSGIGSLGIFFAREGLDVTLADVSPGLLDYAAWRFKRRGLKVNTVDLTRDKLPEDRFDLVTALDVFEHLPTPQATLRLIGESMRQGGVFAFNVAPEDDQHPQHLSSYKDVAWGARAAGFRQKHVLKGVHVLERVSVSPALRPIHAGLGFAWFRVTRPPIVWVLDHLRVKNALKKLIRGDRGRELP